MSDLHPGFLDYQCDGRLKLEPGYLIIRTRVIVSSTEENDGNKKFSFSLVICWVGRYGSYTAGLFIIS